VLCVFDGALSSVRYLFDQHTPRGGFPGKSQVLDIAENEELARYMRSVVTSGTAIDLNRFAIGIAGKTGTAEVEGEESHSWFMGFAPYESGHHGRIAFVVLVENGGYGAGIATKLAADVVSAALALGIIQ
jgi:peptidoglycan glycosyltransferase